MSIRHASFFSGVGGLDQGFERAGIETVSLCEFDPYASAVLAERFPGVPNLGDITKIKKEDVHEADIWSGGFPCQDLSVAGARRGFQDGSRSSLAFRFLDLVEEGRRPRWLVLENVPGLFSSNGGRDFSRLLREVVGLGYGVAWRTLDARHFGVAQRRRRVFIVAALNEAFGGLGAERAAEVLFECSGGCGHLEAGGTKGEGSPSGSGGGVEVSHALRASLGKRGERGDGGDNLVVGTFGADVSNAILSRYHKGINTTVEPGHLVGAEAHADGVREVDGVAGRVDDSEGVEDPRRLGNFELWDFPKESVAPTISAKHDQRVMVYGGEVKAYSVREDAKANNFSATEIEVANALSAVWAGEQSHHAQTFIAAAPVEEGLLSFPSRFGSNADVSEDITQSFAHSAGAPAVFRKSYRAKNRTDAETWVEGDVANTLNTFDVGDIRTTHAVVGLGASDDELDLLPLGLDSHRYRVAGNGVVAPVAEFIGRRLVGVDAKWFKKEVEG
jgi:DNA-cytosine methyltransferase